MAMQAPIRAMWGHVRAMEGSIVEQPNLEGPIVEDLMSGAPIALEGLMRAMKDPMRAKGGSSLLRGSWFRSWQKQGCYMSQVSSVFATEWAPSCLPTHGFPVRKIRCYLL